MLRATTACTFSTSELPEMLRDVFNTFDFQMCFVPQRRVLFQHLNFQKCSETASFKHFLLPNVLRATTACTGSTCQLPELLQTPQFLTHFTSKCALRHNGVHFFNISTSKSGPALRCFVPFHFEIGFAPQSRATFHLSSPQMSPHPPLWRTYFSTLRSHKTTKKHSVSRLSYLFAHLNLLCFGLFLLTLLPADCFFICPYCRKFDFKTAFDNPEISRLVL